MNTTKIKEKYVYYGLEPEDVFKRISTFIATVEGTKAKRKKWSEEFYKEMYEGHFVPGGRVLAGAGATSAARPWCNVG